MTDTSDLAIEENTENSWAASARDRHIVLFDGVCGLCNKYIQMVLNNDRQDLFRFAPLQSQFARDSLTRLGANAQRLDTIYVISNYGGCAERLLAKSDAIIFVLKELKSWFRPLATVIALMPLPVRDRGYDVVAAIRYRLFGKFDQCLLPTAEIRAKFLDMK